ncbi:hypothetical protein RFI_35583 [Reticulomyxa filosa]|uniref:Uncharacterized protein n=1 Tax=Reticulomyxa filosa TaxID=46433 RepID=X6LKG8_RETFI|nr:hypothetical protein RFI_35583 [Reticulomyxa filosa]|eukprot:ETO01856.1 hypothetical protein RFI_35583 [Reticulomyxa filosa]
MVVGGHCVVKVANNDKDVNGITLLSFGGCAKRNKHTLMMKYVSVWNEEENEKRMKSKKSSNFKWLPFTDNNSNPIQIGSNKNNDGTSAIIGGSDNHLLFITQLAKANSGLTETKSSETQKKIKILLFHEMGGGLSIEYDENNDKFEFRNLWICTSVRQLSRYACLCINDSVLFFGGFDNDNDSIVHKEKQWSKEEEEKRHIEEINMELEETKEDINIKKLKVRFFFFFFLQ